MKPHISFPIRAPISPSRQLELKPPEYWKPGFRLISHLKSNHRISVQSASRDGNMIGKDLINRRCTS
jgi:hypothetical protein